MLHLVPVAGETMVAVLDSKIVVEMERKVAI